MTADNTRAQSFSGSLSQLRSAQKSSKGAPLYSLVVNRPLGRVFAAAAHQVGLTPNQVTAISAVFTMVGIAMVAALPPSWPVAVGVTLALVLGYALDAADGQLARLTGGGSLDGEWLDHVIDSFKIATLHLAVLIMMYRYFDLDPRLLLVPLVFSAAYVVHFFGMLLTDLLTRVHDLRTGSSPTTGTPSRMMSMLKLPTDYGVLYLSFILLGVPSGFFVVYVVLTLAMVGYTIVILPTWYRRLRRLG